jgi:hypothetical protein
MEDEKESRSGGVNFGGSGSVNIQGDVVGRDKIVGTQISSVQLEQAFRPIMEAINSAPPAEKAEAAKKVEALKKEAEKGKHADDGVMAQLLEGIVGLVPGAVSAVVSAFGSPILGGLAGPVTKYVLGKLGA